MASTLAQQLYTYGQMPASNARYANALSAIIGTVLEVLDRRELGIQALGTQVLSAANIKAAAHACSADNSIQHISAPFGSGLQHRAELLHKLCLTAPAARVAVEKMAADPKMILLLATLTRSEKRCRSYAMALVDDLIEAQKTQDRIESLDKGYSDEEIAEFKDDPAIKELLNTRTRLQQIEQEMEKNRSTLAEEVLSTINGRNAKRVQEGAVVHVNGKSEAVQVPQFWKEIMGEEFHAEPSIQPGQVFICSNEFPYKRSAEVRLDGGGKLDIRKVVAQLAADCEQHRANLVLLHSLTNESGFNVTGEGDLHHPEYNFVYR